MKGILLAGATGYLGSYLLGELVKQGFDTRVVVRNPQKLDPQLAQEVEVVQAELTQAETMAGCCEGIDGVISSVGITRQKDKLTFMEVDYQANLNLMKEAQRSGVRKFIYVSVLHGEKMQGLAICAAKEKFVSELVASGLGYCIIRPNGFFSDMAEFYHMARKGRVYLFGDGSLRANPIHGADLAKICVEAIHRSEKEIWVGGPETLTHDEIGRMALEAAGKPIRITHLPDWIRRFALFMGRVIMDKYAYGPVEFSLNVMARDMVAPEYGEHTLQAYFEELNAHSQ